jgi:uncharacterized protein involved in outer membrane biogenesis
VNKKHLLWLVPLGLVALLGAAILALPGFVASNTHRASIEGLASSLIGRGVHIGGKLSLGLFPSPKLTAGRITITGPDQETINARSLTLDISLPALLHGRLSAESLVLDAPDIAFPWPLPGGPKAIAPPPWLAALHAQIRNGRISLGTAHFTGVDADLFTDANGIVTVSGTGNLAGRNLSLNLALGAIQLTGAAPLNLTAESGNIALRFSGALDGESELTGQLGLATPQISGTANINADGGQVTASAMRLTHDKASIDGTATFDFAQPKITANLDTQNLDLDGLQTLAGWPGIPIALDLTAANLTVNGQTIPALQTSLDYSASGTAVHSAQITLPGSTAITARLNITPDGVIAGQASLASPDLQDFLASYGVTPPEGWSSAHFTAQLSGTASQLGLNKISGAIDNDNVTGDLVVTGRHAGGDLNFSQLDLTSLIAWLGHRPPGNFTADGEITAAHATFGPVPLTHLLLDAALTDQLNIRRISANVYNGLVAGSLTLDAGGQVTAAHGFLAVPSATPLAALLPAYWQPPTALAQSRLNLAIFAQGPATALSTSTVATLGDFTLTAAPVIDLSRQSAIGPLTLRHPNAIAAFKIFGLDQGLAFPGAGSIALRATMTASPSQIGLPDFILSLGDLTANGRILRTNGTISGQIDADTLAIPPIAANLQIPWADLAAATGKIDISANRVLYAGNPILGGSLGSITLSPDHFTLAVTRASLAQGNLSGTLSATAAATQAPALTAKFTADHIDASQLDLPGAFPFTLPTGTLAVEANLTATGYSPKIWAATLGGTASLAAANGTISGFSLTGLASAFKSKHRAQDLRTALAAGTSAFTSLTLLGSFDHGNCTLNNASLSGPDGSATASGSIDLFDNDLALHLALQPDVTPPLSIGTIILGSWASPKQYPKLKPALDWSP